MQPRAHLKSGPESPHVRQEYGFHRTVCGCAFCRVPCRHLPGSLDVTDLPRLCPPGVEIFAWAQDHLRAVIDKPYPTLVPARHAHGPCHWLFAGQCVVHDNAPYSCAFFDMHMTAEEVDRRSAATIEARRDDAAQHGLYQRVWLHLCRQGLIATPGDRGALTEEMHQIREQTERVGGCG